MITEQQIDLIVEKLLERIEQANIQFLMNIGSSIKQIRKLKPSEAQKLVQILKYGGKYEEIIQELSKITNLNIKDIDEIFYNYAEKDQNFYKKFYEYRNIPYVPFNENNALKMQTMALSNIAKNEMYNFTRTNVLGYTINDIKGRPQFYGLRETYNRVLDEALLNVGQGKETFDSAMSNIMKQLGGSGLKTIIYDSTFIDKDGVVRNRTRRLDSAVKMHLKGRLRELHNENEKIIGQEIGADGIEISVHESPAVDHAKVQGRQFSNEEFEKLQNGDKAKDYKGRYYSLDHDGKNGYRPISEMNCYHYIFSIVLGVSEPEYTDEQLKEIMNKNEKGFYLYDKKLGDYKHYTMYEGTQLQRNLERKIREQKDIQILAKASDNMDLVGESQWNITQLTKQYKKLCEESGLPTKMQRAKVVGYKRMKVK